MMGKVLYMRKGETHAAPSTGIQLADIAEGSIIKLNESGSPVEFYVACHNYESGLNGAGRTLLVRKDVHSYRAWCTESVYSNKYANCDLDVWFNNTYKSLLDENVQNCIQTTKFYYTVGGGTTGNKTVTTLSRSVFALSFTELGATYDGCHNTEGSTLPIASTLLVAYRNGSKVTQDTRSPWLKSDYTNDHSRLIVNTSGSGTRSDCFITNGSRPCFTLPASTWFDANTLELGSNKKVSITVSDTYGGTSALLTSKGLLTVDGSNVLTETAEIVTSKSSVTVEYKLTGDIGAVRNVVINGTLIGSVHYAGDSVLATINVSDGDTIAIEFQK